MERKLVIGNKTVGGLPKEKPPKVSLLRRTKDALTFRQQVRLTLEEEDLIIKVYGQETDSPDFEDLEPERGLASVVVRVRVEPSPTRAVWNQIGGPTEIRIVPPRHLLITRVTSTLPLALQELRPGYEQNLPIAPYRVKPREVISVNVPGEVVSFS
jgi:hypothetical protein